MYPGTTYAGTCRLAGIGITERGFEKQPSMFTLRDAGASDLVPARDAAGNKGTFGKILLVAGRRNMCGAALLAAGACLSAGAGMVKIFTHEANRVIIQQALPEALLDTFTDQETPEQAAAKLQASLEWADIAAAGPATEGDLSAGWSWMQMRCVCLPAVRSSAECWPQDVLTSPVSLRRIWRNLRLFQGTQSLNV